MSNLNKQVIETWQIHNRVMLMTLDHIPEDLYETTQNPRGGGKVGSQLAHIYNVRFWRLEKIDKSLIEGLDTIKKEDPRTKEDLRSLYEYSSEQIEKVISASLENDGKVKSFKRGIVPMIGYMISHEAHHRGNTLHTLKIGGFKVPMDLKYGIWEWNKI